MTLEINPWARQDRLERIAAAERDRRAGRIELALATLGDAAEWPARIVAALACLPDDEGAETRARLEEMLDVWAEEAGVEAALAGPTESDPEEPAPEAALEEAFIVGDPQGETLGEDLLAAPIEAGELDLAFASAEAQVDEMHDVNEVAERILADEPVGLAELADVGDVALSDPMEGASGGLELPMDAATSGAALWPEATDVVAEDGKVAPRVLATLERWLDNLEARKARGPHGSR